MITKKFFMTIYNPQYDLDCFKLCLLQKKVGKYSISMFKYGYEKEY